ncbi:hypothetical protein ASA1KI_12770 [Opitutales bacterium ASA1]|uniref:hypothetical protein n=1 Tax=Congregicoccus parvus TaxID=3081749 RepID=UPI002B2AC5A2|nr:hypothetical protein ASA1KI_12770 [Opitutales bacterium ASA1]
MNVAFHMTKTGGQLGPVVFRLGRRVIEPFHTAPWCGKPEAKKLIPLLRELRGDFFCAPFGAGPGRRGEEHPPHGETANADWTISSVASDRLVADLRLRVRPGKVTKVIEARPDETNLYQTHVFEGLKGEMCFGHHAMLDFNRNGPGSISTSKLRLAQVLPVRFEDPAQGGYSSLRQGAWFRRLEQVPMADGGKADLTRYPAREGFEDLVMLHHKDEDDFAWAAVVFAEKKFVWFSLKNPAHLASTVLWHSNGGRHYAPWSGRHRGVLGVEDVTAYFHLGLGASLSANPWKDKGVPTSLDFSRGKRTRIPYVMGVAALPDGFDRVRGIRRIAGGIRLESFGGAAIEHALDTSFLR